MRRPCDQCGTDYEAKRKTSRFCSPACRVQHSRRPDLAATVVALPAPAAEPAVESTEAVTRAELVKHDRVLTPHGQAALQLARALDSPNESGSAKAALARQLAATMDLALTGIQVAGDKVDELASRRAKRAGA